MHNLKKQSQINLIDYEALNDVLGEYDDKKERGF